MTYRRKPPVAAFPNPAREPISADAGRKVQDAIGRALEAHYVELVREPIPDRLLELLAKLEAGDLQNE